MRGIHFFTIVLNGMPFIKYHLGVLESLSIPWHWHIIEGLANLKHDTAWGINKGAYIHGGFHNHGLSVDGTTEYINALLNQGNNSITVYRKTDGGVWDGKVEMVNKPLVNIGEDCLLWQLDVDELWTKENIEKTYSLFKSRQNKLSAYFYCFYFLGPKKYIVSEGVKSTGIWDWMRVWRYWKGLYWRAHEPPILVDIDGRDVGKINPIVRQETLEKGITFQHFAYATLASVVFKESYYGYKGVVDSWKQLQAKRGRVQIDEGFPGVWPGTVVDDWDESKNGELLWKN